MRAREWLGRLLDPVTPGMTPDTPRAKPLALLCIGLFIAGQVVVRYELRILYGKQWQAVHILFGLAGAMAIITAFHGPGVLKRVRRETWLLLAGGVLFFCLFWYLGRMDSYRRFFRAHIDHSGPLAPIYAFIYFSMAGLFFRTFIPLLYSRFVLGYRPAQLGFYAPGNPHPPAVKRIWPVYLALFLGVLPFVVGAAATAPFLAKYPLCKEIISNIGHIRIEHLLLYELFYLFIFVSGEGFWRGYLTFGTERDFGVYGIALMLVPYVTGHFGKPLAETLGAIAAGTILGWLALKHRSVWLGVAIHYSVAITMDMLAIGGNGFVIDFLH